MTITKNQLKSIVKECLLEILSEGIGPSTSMMNESKTSHKKSPSLSSVMQQTASKTKFVNNTQALKETIRREAGGNPIMADILADTAAKTLPTMLENDRTKMVAAPVGTIERAVANHSPEQLFGEEAASKWAALAFADPINKFK
jgi:hypothetical protein